MGNAKIPSMKQIRVGAENYRTTVNALLCFADFLKNGNRGARFSLGRRMTTSNQNEVSKNTDQTPDMIHQNSETEGYICEAKASMSLNEDGWDKHVLQLKRYDDDLIGWWTADGKLQTASNTVLLLDSARTRRFRKYTESQMSKNGLAFHKPIAYVGFVQKSNPEEAVLFQLDWGKIENKGINDDLELTKTIPLEPIVGAHSVTRFCDYEPPVEYTMEILWNHVFNDMKRQIDFDEITKSHPLEVNVPLLTEQVQKSFGQYSTEEREMSFPNITWIRNALDHFEVIKLAKKTDLDNYTVYFRSFRTDLIEKFSVARREMKKMDEKKKQLELFAQNKPGIKKATAGRNRRS